MHYRPFKSVLVANRGEIASRIIREARAAGLRSIAIFSDADRHADHVTLADTAIRVGAAMPNESYLHPGRILAAAKATRADAIHPGYGFLSENADFAQAVVDAGLVWIGPSPDAIRAMADKGNAKDLARKARVPVIPGYDGEDQSDERLLQEARKIGWPVLLKAALGGGGRGQRKVTREEDFLDALSSARREALSAFASDRMILEKALEKVRHVEVQVFGDSHGNVIHLGERDCSVQRRNQKIIEEAPAPGVGDALRHHMGAAAVALAKAVNYTNAGTVEYLLDGEGNFWFLEMNTRIQVEHPVTEEVTGTNLIQWQFSVASGEALPLRQGDVEIRGHSIEVRLCAEDPVDGFAPQTGTAHIGTGNCRIDSPGGIAHVSGDYDSMLAKVIAKGATRQDAIEHLQHQLQDLPPAGIRTNRNYVLDILSSQDFMEGACTIDWLSARKPYAENHTAAAHAAAAAIFLDHGAGQNWRSNGLCRSIITLQERREKVTLAVENFRCNGYQVTSVRPEGDSLWAELQAPDGTITNLTARFFDNHVHVSLGGRDALFEDVTYAPAERKDAAGAGAVRAPMAGRIVKVLADASTRVAKGDLLVILEAMKMEHELRAAIDGTVENISIKPGDQVSMRQLLVTVNPGTAG